MRYTLTLKDEVLPRGPDGREQSTVSYEYDFCVPDVKRSTEGRGMSGSDGKGPRVRVPWNALKATYRGREKNDADPIDLKNVRRFSLMMRR